MLKRRVLVFSSHYLPGHNAGGPIRSLESIFNLLSDDVDFYLVTSDRDLGDTVAYEGIEANTWIKVGHIMVYYSSQKLISARSLKNILVYSRPSTIYLNSLFSFAYSIYVLFLLLMSDFKNVRLVLAPRGELSQGALEQKKLKKFIFTQITKHIKVYKNIDWHVSTKHERLDLIKIYGDHGKVHIASNLVDDTRAKLTRDHKLAKQEGEIKIIFVSRISKKKNLDFAIESLKNLKGRVSFDVYGPSEDLKYVEICSKMASGFSSNISVVFKGDVEHKNVPNLFKSYDVFYLPTKGENFGQVIWESLSCGCPVLISDQTPWDDLDSQKVGWALPLSKMQDFSRVLQGIIDDSPRYQVDREKVHSYALSVANTSDSLVANRKIFINSV